MDSQQPPSTAHSGSHRPDSVISSAISEDGDPAPSQSNRSSLPSQSQATPSRASRKGPPLKDAIGRNSIGAGANTSSSRPQSSTSRVSRSHVPALASAAFFRPMSSQQAQRQRGGRPITAATTASAHLGGDAQSETGTDPRHSLSTVTRTRVDSTADAQPPPSRGTEYTEDHADRATSPTGNGTVRSLDDSVNLLSNGSRAMQSRPQHLNLKNSNTAEAPAKSPRSFRSGFSMGTKRQSQQHAEGGHQVLSSETTSPRQSEFKPSDPFPAKSKLGKNYEYFEGNTAFFWGGRLQNARDRPVNIATGICVLLPGVLFFVFS